MDIASLLAPGLTVIGSVVLALWATYTVVWRAVRRGIREANRPTPASASYPGVIYPPEWSSKPATATRGGTRQASRTSRPLRAVAGRTD